MAGSLDQSLIDEIVRRMVTKPDRNILSGSQARGEAREDSDLDLRVVMREVKSRREALMRIREVIVPLGMSCDVLVATGADGERWGDAPSTTLSWAKREEEVLHEAAA